MKSYSVTSCYVFLFSLFVLNSASAVQSRNLQEASLKQSIETYLDIYGAEDFPFDPAADAEEEESIGSNSTAQSLLKEDLEDLLSFEDLYGSQEPVAPLANSSTRYKIDINLSTWRLNVYSNGALLPGYSNFQISPGSSAKPTPKGTYGITHLIWNARSARYNNAPMPWSVFFIGTVYAIHEGNLDSRSRGCVRLSHTNAKKLYNFVSANGKHNFNVYIH